MGESSVIVVDFRCENCRLHQQRIEVIDGDVTCSDCEHTVSVGVYLSPVELSELMDERDPAVPLTEI